jgi:hypothetical protein
MNREQAIVIAESSRGTFRVPAELKLRGAQKVIIELVEGETRVVVDQPPEPGPVYDLVAWVVVFSGGYSSFQMTIDDATGRVVRVRRSR